VCVCACVLMRVRAYVRNTFLVSSQFVSIHVRAFLRACVCACVCAYARACVRA